MWLQFTYVEADGWRLANTRGAQDVDMQNVVRISRIYHRQRRSTHFGLLKVRCHQITWRGISMGSLSRGMLCDLKWIDLNLKKGITRLQRTFAITNILGPKLIAKAFETNYLLLTKG